MSSNTMCCTDMAKLHRNTVEYRTGILDCIYVLKFSLLYLLTDFIFI